MLALATVMSVGNAPEPNLVRGTESLANLEPCIFALEFISPSTIELSTMLALLTILSSGNTPVCSLVYKIPASDLMSAFTIVPSTMLLDETVMSVGKAPPPSLDNPTESFASLDPAISALELISESTILRANLL